jgi:hypothetical protein
VGFFYARVTFVTDSPRPIQVGDELHGYCGGYFGRDHYDCGIVEAVGRDWLVLRTMDAGDPSHAISATGPGILQELARYRIPDPSGCKWGQCDLRPWRQ